ncbi:HAD-IB family hydrolase [Campylobacter sp.]|uniref:HAD-IB family hydrolase n=1 Tax=Campylobacter sp. TaxID=205 RepID=UPI0026DC471E|nr:HAD-IB family hydrolase [Campylobacter sp.]MDO4674675.1 HAD-IB family hydrolase [Campylobacter sp.]
MREILALFDFCETLTTFQTLDRFLPLAGRHNPHFEASKNKARRQAYAAMKKPYPRYESLIDLNLDRARILAKKFLYDEIIPGLRPALMKRLFYHQDAGHTVAIVSGGLALYIEEFAKLYGIEHVVAVELEVREGLLSGDIEGIHTMQERKLYKLAQRLTLEDFDLRHSFAYSDCVSDIPLLSLVGNAYAVNCGRDLRWAEILGFGVMG